MKYEQLIISVSFYNYLEDIFFLNFISLLYNLIYFNILQYNVIYVSIKFSQYGLMEIFYFLLLMFSFCINGSHYELLLKLITAVNYILKLKITSYSCDGKKKVSFHHSQYQKEIMNSITYPNEYFLAVVFGINNYRKYFFMNLKNNIIKSRICDDEY